MNRTGAEHRHDVAVMGLGPAGRALVHRAVERGLDVVAVDPYPDRPWPATYAAWIDEVPAWLGDGVWRSRIARPSVHGLRERMLDRAYGVFDNAALRRRLDLSGARTVAARARGLGRRSVLLDGAGRIDARTVIDARGLRPDPALAEQTAFGIAVPAHAASPAMGGADAWFMDWRPDNAVAPGAPPSFLYAMPLGDGTVLLEETCLVGRPGLPFGELRRRLAARLSARGVSVPSGARVERVRFPIEAPGTAGPAPAFGARAGLGHPGTGYSVAASLAAADTVIDALADGRDPWPVLWPRRARAVRRMRETGLSALLDLDPAVMPGFFDAFFALPMRHQRAYLSGRSDLGGTASSMWSLFRAVDPATRRTLVRAAVRRR